MLCLAECIMIHNARSCLLLRPGSAHGHYMITLILPMQSLHTVMYSLLKLENKYQSVNIKSSPEFIGVQTCICYRDLSYSPSLAPHPPAPAVLVPSAACPCHNFLGANNFQFWGSLISKPLCENLWLWLWIRVQVLQVTQFQVETTCLNAN